MFAPMLANSWYEPWSLLSLRRRASVPTIISARKLRQRSLLSLKNKRRRTISKWVGGSVPIFHGSREYRKFRFIDILVNALFLRSGASKLVWNSNFSSDRIRSYRPATTGSEYYVLYENLCPKKQRRKSFTLNISSTSLVESIFGNYNWCLRWRRFIGASKTCARCACII